MSKAKPRDEGPQETVTFSGEIPKGGNNGYEMQHHRLATRVNDPREPSGLYYLAVANVEDAIAVNGPIRYGLWIPVKPGNDKPPVGTEYTLIFTRPYHQEDKLWTFKHAMQGNYPEPQ